jgi:hypothetical protein
MPQTELNTLIGQIAAKLETVEGINFAPADPPGTIGQSPFAVMYLSSGEGGVRASNAVVLYSELTVHVGLPLRDMRRANEIILPIGQDAITALFQGLKDGDIEAQNFDSVRYQYGPFVWGGIEMFGWTVVIERLLTKEALT